MTFRIAVVQPIAHRPGTDENNNCAAKQGLLGPQWQRPGPYDLIHPRPLREAAE